MRPIKLFLEEVHMRAWPGGMGDLKVGGNYAPTILPQALAAGQGAPQVQTRPFPRCPC
jgi:branched-subunit amino acid aminotransferase/4-amino-4-deoxychorismate lyase